MWSKRAICHADNTAPPLFISADEVEKLLRLEDLIAVLEKALKDYSAGHVTQPLRSIVNVSQHAGWFGLMPAVYEDVFGAKLVTVFPNNAVRNLATHQASIHLFRSDTGEPLAVMDGRVITAWRTAAVSAIATKALSSPQAEILAILGSGTQARTHFEALRMVRDFKEIRVWSRTPAHSLQFAEETGARATDLETAVRGADVIVTVTNASEPFLRGSWLKNGVYVNAVGAVGLKARELDEEAMLNAAIVVESRESALAESAEIVQSGVPIYAEIGEILAESKAAPRGARTVFKSLGIAVEDVAVARLVYQKARDRV